MQKKSTPLVDEHLQNLQGMQEANTDDFFYTRLKARMLAKQSIGVNNKLEPGWNFPLKPVWIVGTLLLLLAMNGFILTQQPDKEKTNSTASASPLQKFAQSYDQSISSY